MYLDKTTFLHKHHVQIPSLPGDTIKINIIFMLDYPPCYPGNACMFRNASGYHKIFRYIL